MNADEVSGACSIHGGDEECIQNCSQKTRRYKPFGRLRWEDNINMDLKK
jgi:hypothetical protein